jgi:putative oxidoreductase
MDLSLSVLLIRFTVGMLLMGHGAQKLVGIGGGPGLRGWTAAVGQLGFRPAGFWAIVSVCAEFLGGVALAIGFLTPIAAALVVGQMFVAIAKAHWSKGLWITAGGYEYSLVLLVVATAIGLGGPGRYSVDAALGLDTVSAAIFVPLAAVVVIVDALLVHNTPAPVAPKRDEHATGRPEDGARRRVA